MIKISDTAKFYLLSLIFILTNAFFIYKGFYLLGLLPLVIIVVMLAFLRLDNFLIITVFMVPVSIPMYELVSGLGVNLSLPAELLLVGGLVLFIFKILKGEYPDKRILKHPVTVVIYFNLVWILVTSFTSSMPLVSFKFFLSRLWFVAVFYFIASEVFLKRDYFRKYVWAYIIPFLGVIAFATTRLFSIGLFDQQAAHWVMNPFYNDHTSYGATLAMLIPVMIGFVFSGSLKSTERVIAAIVLPVLIGAIVLSYSRAAWLSLVVALGVLLAVRLRIKFVTIFIISSIAGLLLFQNFTKVFFRLEQNKTASSADIAQHIESMSNITSDYSNVERFNRWDCAIRMFKKRPFFGWGPGTYMFQYAPFQISYEKTPISTNMGDKGNAHSEYLGPLAESGFFGTLTFLLILIFIIYTGLKVHKRMDTRSDKILLLSVLLGLITYFTHGLLNNFLDTDKASALFWAYIALIVVMDIKTTYNKVEKLPAGEGKP